MPYSFSLLSAQTTWPTRHLYGASMATRTSMLGSKGTLERIRAPWRLTRMVSAAPLTCDPSLFWPETAKGKVTRTRELLRPRSTVRCFIGPAKQPFRRKETIELPARYRILPQAKPGSIEKLGAGCPKVITLVPVLSLWVLRSLHHGAAASCE